MIGETEVIDKACELFRRLTKGTNASRIEVTVWSDGRVEMRAEDGPYTRDKERADVSGRGDQMPSCAYCDLRDRLNVPEIPDSSETNTRPEDGAKREPK